MMASVLAATSEDSGDGAVLVFILPLVVGIGLFWLVHNFYRNSNARFKYEDHTHAEVHNLRAQDAKFRSRTGLSSPTIAGGNHEDVNARIPVSAMWPEPATEPRIPDANNPGIQQATPPLGQPPQQATPPLGQPPQQAAPPVGGPQQAAPPYQPPAQQPPYEPPTQQPPYQPPAQ